MDEEEVSILLRRNQLLAAFLLHNSKKERIRIWVRDIWQNREAQGHYHNLIQEMRLKDVKMYFNYLRMDPETFEELLCMVGSHIQRKTTRFRKPIPAGMKLAVTLRYLATGVSQADLSFNFRLGRSTICKILEEVPMVIAECLRPISLQMPDSPEKWKKIADDYWHIWNYRHCV